LGEPRLWIGPDTREITADAGLVVTMRGENMARMQFQSQGSPMLMDFVDGQTVTVGAGLPVGGSNYLVLDGTGRNGDPISETFTFVRVEDRIEVGDNLLENWSFEYADMSMWLRESHSGQPTDASGGSGFGRGTFPASDQMVRTGTAALRFWHGGEQGLTIRQYVDIPVSGTFDFSAWFQGQNAGTWSSHAWPFVSLVEGSTATPIGGGSNTHRVDMGSPGAWRELAVTGLELSAGDRVVVGVTGWMSPGSWGSFDDFALTLVEAREICEWDGDLYADDALCRAPIPVRSDVIAVQRGNRFTFQNTNRTFYFGNPTDEFFIGDWDGDGYQTLALRRGSQFVFINEHTATADRISFHFGAPGDEVLVGDWDGDGRDTIALRRGSEFIVINELRAGAPVTRFHLGAASDRVFVGDWDGNGTDSVALRRGSEFIVVNEMRAGAPVTRFQFGGADDQVFVGDWDGNGTDTVAVHRRGRFAFAAEMRAGTSAHIMYFGRLTDTPFVGDWDGDGAHSVGIRRNDYVLDEDLYILTNSLEQHGGDRTRFNFGPYTATHLIGRFAG
jgi:hypothetical protein